MNSKKNVGQRAFKPVITESPLAPVLQTPGKTCTNASAVSLLSSARGPRNPTQSTSRTDSRSCSATSARIPLVDELLRDTKMQRARFHRSRAWSGFAAMQWRSSAWFPRHRLPPFARPGKIASLVRRRVSSWRARRCQRLPRVYDREVIPDRVVPGRAVVPGGHGFGTPAQSHRVLVMAGRCPRWMGSRLYPAALQPCRSPHRCAATRRTQCAGPA